VIYSTGVSGDPPLEFIRVFADIVEQPTCACCDPHLEPPPEVTGESAGSPQMPFQAFPRLAPFANSAMGIKDGICSTTRLLHCCYGCSR
jgi:hypothetical protein